MSTYKPIDVESTEKGHKVTLQICFDSSSSKPYKSDLKLCDNELALETDSVEQSERFAGQLRQILEVIEKDVAQLKLENSLREKYILTPRKQIDHSESE
ncbi:hypothetical protein SAMN05444392_102380 [Seinonella peptonophila]|uniref:Uncharacterized protein n=1 Tax=Seinonella peptonophila TaxID=112248 RepID=A0A1M4VIM5_9BACL|nr:hypothetical protein [Seinonella peptonophila]SHE68760.1 hypothetical protein SAMN05444392_102380 [Seinonella peptonophila]